MMLMNKFPSCICFNLFFFNYFFGCRNDNDYPDSIIIRNQEDIERAEEFGLERDSPEPSGNLWFI